MKSIYNLSTISIYILLIALVSCTPAVNAGRDAATSASNSIFCDTQFKATSDGFYLYSGESAIDDVYITVQGDLVTSEGLSKVSDRLYDASLDSLEGYAYFSLTTPENGYYVALASYVRGSKVYACALE